MLGKPNSGSTTSPPAAMNFLPSFQLAYQGEKLVFGFCNYVVLMHWVRGNKSFISRSYTSGKHCPRGTIIYSGLLHAIRLTLAEKTLIWTPLIYTQKQSNRDSTNSNMSQCDFSPPPFNNWLELTFSLIHTLRALMEVLCAVNVVCFFHAATGPGVQI